MRRQLTDVVMLRDAERRLSEHLQTRPATADEAGAIRESLLATAERFDAGEPYRPLPAAELRSVAGQHGEAIAVGQSLHCVLRNRAEAGRYRLQAAAWDGDMAGAWERTRQELQARVDYYRQLSEVGNAQ